MESQLFRMEITVTYHVCTPLCVYSSNKGERATNNKTMSPSTTHVTLGPTSILEGYTTFLLRQSLPRPSKVSKLKRGDLFYVVHFTNSNHNVLPILNLWGSVVVLSPIQLTIYFRAGQGSVFTSLCMNEIKNTGTKVRTTDLEYIILNLICMCTMGDF
jgi:hypothetical protein